VKKEKKKRKKEKKLSFFFDYLMDCQMKKVPWANWEEWQACWELLQTSPLKALETLEIWNHVQPLPVRVESTRVLLRCLQDLTKSGNPQEFSTLKSETSRLALSMAIVRCTNLIIDTYNDCKFARSVSQTAKSINLPEFIVDLRHDATHSTLPSGFLLSKAFQALITWLFENYWAKQAEVLTSKKNGKVLNDIEKFEKRARTVSEHITLVKFSEGLFNEKIIFKEKTGKTVAKLRWNMNEDAWAMLFLAIRGKNNFFPEAVMQGVFALLQEKEISSEQAKVAVQEILALAGNVKIHYSTFVKFLMRMQNEDREAFETVKVLIEHSAFDDDCFDIVKKMHDFTVFSERKADTCEILQLPMKRWRDLKTWTARPIGSYSVFT
jgi:hypothetical protein